MKILFLVPYPVGEAPSQRFRFEQYFTLLADNQINYTVKPFWSLRAWKILYKPGFAIEKFLWMALGFLLRCGHCFQAIYYNKIFIHRECAPVGPPVFEFLLSKVLRKKIIYDFDDAIWLPNTSQENQLARWFKFHRKVKSICRWSEKVSCGNAWLAEFARQFNNRVLVNPTTIDTQYQHNPQRLKKQEANARVILGWTGTHSTLPYLLDLMPVLQSIAKKHAIVVRVISNKNPKLPLANFEFVPWQKESEFEDLFQFDIGLMPLTDSSWAKGKCGFKALQYMALEIPCVASPVGVNTEIVEHGRDGFLCANHEAWLEVLDQLISDRELRARIGKAGRQAVEARFSVSSNSASFLSLVR